MATPSSPTQERAGVKHGGVRDRRMTHVSPMRSLILAATQNRALSWWARRYGPRLGATRFVAGETMEECVAVLQELHSKGLRGYAIELGEQVTDRTEVASTTAANIALAQRLAEERVHATMAIKLTHVGLAIDEQLAYEHAREIIAAAAEEGIFVRMDMEDSQWVDATLRIYRRLREGGLANTGIVLQAYLRRTLTDLRSMADLGLNVRVVKGAYLERPSIAFPTKHEVDENYHRLIDAALEQAAFTAIATHDQQAIAHAAKSIAGRNGQLQGSYEFQMLYGVRPQLQSDLVARNHPVRVCVPYGEDWFMYFGRRLAERPANIMFVLRSLIAR